MALAIGNTAVCSTHGNGVQITFNHTCVAGSNILIVTFGACCKVQYYSGDLSVTYNGVAMTEKIEQQTEYGGYYFDAAIFYLLNPPTGSAYQVAGLMNYQTQFGAGSIGAIDAAGAHATQNGATAYGTNKSLTLTGATEEDLCIDCMSAWTGGQNLTPTGTDQIEMWDFPSAGDSFSWAASRITRGLSDPDFVWTVPSEVKSLHVAAAFVPAARGCGAMVLGGMT